MRLSVVGRALEESVGFVANSLGHGAESGR